MLKIAYCDDSAKVRQQIQSALIGIQIKWNTSFEMKSFISGEELVEEFLKNTYDIVLLDILMDGIDGIETAKKIRKLAQESLIIFISNYDKRWKELMGQNTIAFLDKPLDSNQLEIVLGEAKEIIDNRKDIMFIYKVNGMPTKLLLKDILYWEGIDHYVIIHLKDRSIKYKGKISEVWEQMEACNKVVRPHRSYVVNLRYAHINKTSVKILNIIEIPIGRIYKDVVLEKFRSYLNEGKEV